jgi:hypothetical protein
MIRDLLGWGIIVWIMVVCSLIITLNLLRHKPDCRCKLCWKDPD